LQGRPSATAGQWLKGFWAFEQWRRVSSTRHRHWRHVGSRVAAKTNRETGGSVTASFPFPFLAGGGKQRHLQNTKKRKQQCF